MFFFEGRGVIRMYSILYVYSYSIEQYITYYTNTQLKGYLPYYPFPSLNPPLSDPLPRVK